MIGCRWCTELDTYSATRPAVGGVPVLFWVNKLSDSKTDQALLALVVRRSGGKLLDPTVAPVAPCVLVGRGVGRAVGRGVGRPVGRGVGRPVGRGVGRPVGRPVGPVAPCVLVGRGVGRPVGRPVGRAVVSGAAVGGTGLTVALPVGCAVKPKPPALVGPIVGLLAELLELPNAPMGG